MKKKLLVFCVLVMMVMCLFAISISAATEVIDGLTYDLQSNGTARLGKNANQGVAVETLIIPEKVTGSDGKEYTVTEIYEGSFKSNKNIKYVSLPPTITVIGAASFNSCSNLVFIDFNDNQNNVSMINWGVFKDCSSLKAVCLPDNMKTIGDQAFTNCKALTAVYLPANLEIIKGNKGDGPAFGGQNSGNACKELFFTNEKFEVRDENGDFYTAETFKVPEKPSVYYFPSTLKAMTGAHNKNNNAMDSEGMIISGGMSDCGIQHCTGINSVLVLPEGYMGYADQPSGDAILDENQLGDTLNNGLLPGCGIADNPLTVVFMGKIHRVSMDRKDGNTKYTTYVFANKANTGFENTKIGTWYNTSDTAYRNQDEMYVVFCHANNGEGAKYKIGFKGQEGKTTYPVLTSELQEGAIIHTVSPILSKAPEGVPCPNDNPLNTFCFCGKTIDVNAHQLDLLSGATEIAVKYENYFANGKRLVKCADCEHNEEIEVNPIITSFKGYSVKENGNGIVVGYTLDKEALKEYERVNGKPLEYGFVLAVKAKIGENAPINADGVAYDGVIKQAITSTSYTGVEFKLSGNVWDKEVTVNGEAILLKDLEIVLTGYIFGSTGVVYVSNEATSENAATVCYNQLLQ